MDEQRLREIEEEARHSGAHEGETLMTLVAEVRRLRAGLERARNRYEALEGEGFYMEGVGETAWAMHADAVETLRGE